MNLSALNFFRNLRVDNRQFAVIGLGRFGRAVCSTLHELGYEVLGIDRDERPVALALTEHIVSHALQLDSTEPTALEEAGIYEFDTVIVAIGNYIQESTITTLNVKEGGVKQVVAKASSEIHGKLLQRVGADLVVFPEREMGCNLARSLTRPGMLDRFILDSDHSIVEIMIPEPFDGKTLAELNLRAKFGVSVLAVGEDEKVQINPGPRFRLSKALQMVVIGCNDDIDRLMTCKLTRGEKAKIAERTGQKLDKGTDKVKLSSEDEQPGKLQTLTADARHPESDYPEQLEAHPVALDVPSTKTPVKLRVADRKTMSGDYELEAAKSAELENVQTSQTILEPQTTAVHIPADVHDRTLQEPLNGQQAAPMPEDEMESCTGEPRNGFTGQSAVLSTKSPENPSIKSAGQSD